MSGTALTIIDKDAANTWHHAVAADHRMRPLQREIAAVIAQRMDERGRAIVSSRETI
jgi:phosphatidylethanolamine-binding protein (PEBP) family uncharacterized protein